MKDAKVDVDKVGANGEAEAGIIFGAIVDPDGVGVVVRLICVGACAEDAIVKDDKGRAEGSFES